MVDHIGSNSITRGWGCWRVNKIKCGEIKPTAMIDGKIFGLIRHTPGCYVKQLNYLKAVGLTNGLTATTITVVG